jgi:hypothetical protein
VAARPRSPLLRNLTRATVIAERVATADTFWTRFLGLMGRETLAPGEGLWLPGVNNIHMFFMRFPIDAVFLAAPDTEGRREVVGMRPNLRPWRDLVLPVNRATSVIELPAGTLVRAGVQLGSTLAFEPVADTAGPVDSAA